MASFQNKKRGPRMRDPLRLSVFFLAVYCIAVCGVIKAMLALSSALA
jgi:hypothetical protein